MLTLDNEPADGLVLTMNLVHDVEGVAEPIPAGELVRIVGVAVDDAGNAMLWDVSWNGGRLWALPDELRPAAELVEIA